MVPNQLALWWNVGWRWQDLGQGLFRWFCTRFSHKLSENLWLDGRVFANYLDICLEGFNMPNKIKTGVRARWTIIRGLIEITTRKFAFRKFTLASSFLWFVLPWWKVLVFQVIPAFDQPINKVSKIYAITQVPGFCCVFRQLLFNFPGIQ